MLRKLFLFTLLLAPFGFSLAQGESKYRVHLTDKEGVSFDPHSYFSEAAIERRRLHGIPLDHPSDRPLKAAYVKKVRSIAGSVLFKSRWFNMLYVRMNGMERRKVAALPCVQRIEEVQSQARMASTTDSAEADTGWVERLLHYQTRKLGLEEFRAHGLTGEGIRIAVFDNGFEGVKENPIFQHLFEDEQILHTRDFVQNDGHVYDGGSHGRMVLSCIAGITQDSVPMGLATDAEFLLARTERTMWELFSEEENWLAAAEWADRHGARIINSSLGYVHHRYFPRDMDGTSYVAKAANKAARKGILVVTSAGNSGGGDWRVVGTPADADSALAIGGISPSSGVHISFSSYGPAADGDLKPNLTAYGTAAVANGSTGMTNANGTSFSSPLVAGFAACALQSDTSMRTMEFFEEMERSGSLYPYYDFAHGYGVPRAAHFTGTKEKPDPSFQVDLKKDSLIVKVPEESLPEDPEEEYEEPGKIREPLYYHLLNEEGEVKEYAVLRVEEPRVLEEPLLYMDAEKVRIHYKGFTKTIDLSP